MKNLLKKYDALSVKFKALLWFFMCSILQRGISVATTPIFTRIMTTSEYGQFSVFNSWMSIIMVFVTLQLSGGVFSMGIVKFEEEADIFTSSLQGLTLVLCFMWSVVYLLFQDFWNDLFTLTTTQMLAMILLIWASTVFNFWMVTQRNSYQYRLLVIVTLISSIFRPLIEMFLVLHSNDKTTARILGYTIVDLAAYSWMFFWHIKRGKKFFSARFWKYAILFNLPLIPHYLSNSILESSDRIMIQRMESEASAGVYSLAYSTSRIMLIVSNSINMVMAPWIYQKIHKKLYSDIKRMVYPALFLIAFVNLCLIAAAPEVVSFFAPAEYYEAIYIIPPVSMSVYVDFLYMCFVGFEFYFEKRIWTTVGTTCSAIINIILNYICIPRFGYYAAGYTTLICLLFNSFLHYYFMRKVCTAYLGGVYPYDLKILLSITGGTMAIAFLYIPMYRYAIMRYIMTIVLVLVCFTKRKYFQPIVKEGISSMQKK